ncbi:hypothetical protein GMJAKD_01695 [Candidatus Electrothrix aarhusensis]
MPAVGGIQRKTGVLRGLCWLLFWRFAQSAFFAVRKQGVAGRQLSIDRLLNGVTTVKVQVQRGQGWLSIDRIWNGVTT